ncbi:MAG: peptide chain release factor N(5)-glutamine methyltransferase [Alphaproteobacteria bacterium]|nr:peptide chain release factor N(5)-glutamine methyltransferase [Alphaproteobacteria bacterium]
MQPLNPDMQKNILRALAIKRGMSYAQLRFEWQEISITGEEHAYILEVKQRLERHEPLSKIIGIREFYGLDFMINEHVLDPRPDSEILIDAVLNTFSDRQYPYYFLDLGTGSGCLIITLLKHYPKAKACAVDICEQALKVANHNARLHQVNTRIHFFQGSWFDPIKHNPYTPGFDGIVTNPPYIAQDYPLSDTVRLYDPEKALFSGTDGLDDYRHIIPQVSGYLKPEGVFFGEIGFDQKRAIELLVQDHPPLIFNTCLKDDAGHDRVVVLTF